MPEGSFPRTELYFYKMESQITVQDIFIYPIKSLAGIRVSSAKVEERGFEHDRRWMLVDQEGIFLTQRTHHQMAMIQVELEADGLLVYDRNDQSNRVKIPFETMLSEQIEVTIWDDQVMANLVDPAVDSWFSDLLGMSCRLVKMPLSTERKVGAKYAVNNESVSFADGMPYLIIGQESLNHLNSKLIEKVEMNRFRPNIVFSGGESYQEDNWRNIKIGSVGFFVVKPCARCVLITVDQDSGKAGKEPLKTLASYRTLNNKVYFGQNMVALEDGIIRVGDTISF